MRCKLRFLSVLRIHSMVAVFHGVKFLTLVDRLPIEQPLQW